MFGFSTLSFYTIQGESGETWTAKIKAFEEKEKERIRLKMNEYDIKCKRKLAQLVESNQNLMRELEEIHVIKLYSPTHYFYDYTYDIFPL
jgi:esterase/lipase